MAGLLGITSATARRHDPLRGFKFRVYIPGIGVVGFSRVSGLKEETEVVPYREGTDPITPRKMPGITNYDNVTFEHGVSGDNRLVLWRQEILDINMKGGANGTQDGGGQINFRRRVQIKSFDKDGFNIRTWVLLNAWPVSLEYSDLNANDSGILIETMVVAHEGMLQSGDTHPFNTGAIVKTVLNTDRGGRI